MFSLRIGVQLSALKQPFKKALHAAARMGAAGVEIEASGDFRPAQMTRTAIREVRKMADDLNLRICAARFPTRRGFGAPEGLEARVSAAKQTLEMAYHLGALVVPTFVGVVPDDLAGSQAATMLAALGDLGRHAERAGAVVAAQTGAESGARLRALLAALPEGALYVSLDPGNLILNGFSPTEALEQVGDHVAYAVARDAARDFAQARTLETPLGRGSADIPRLLGLLEERQYRGYLTVARQQCDDPERELALAVEYLRNL